MIKYDDLMKKLIPYFESITSSNKWVPNQWIVDENFKTWGSISTINEDLPE